MKHHDISPLISPRTAVFPGDTAFSRRVALDFKKGDNLVLSAIETTLHVGAHTDAPNHYDADGGDIASVDLSTYLGRAQVLVVAKPRGTRISRADLEPLAISAPRVLIKTGSFPDSDRWNHDFVALSAGAVDLLAERGVRLVGIDTPSVDLADDRELESHRAIFRHGLAILEGIVLDTVPAGIYTLIALPLKIEGADASPVRAILIEGDLA